jgi:hypothetical protein
MGCPRCQADADLQKSGWCGPCERAFDTWVRRHATDIVWSALCGGVVMSAVGIGLPLLGVGWIVAAGAAFAGWGTILGVWRFNAKRRRQQFLQLGDLPRAYLPAPK